MPWAGCFPPHLNRAGTVTGLADDPVVLRGAEVTRSCSPGQPAGVLDEGGQATEACLVLRTPTVCLDEGSSSSKTYLVLKLCLPHSPKLNLMLFNCTVVVI